MAIKNYIDSIDGKNGINITEIECRMCYWRTDVANGDGLVKCPKCGSTNLGFNGYDRRGRMTCDEYLEPYQITATVGGEPGTGNVSNKNFQHYLQAGFRIVNVAPALGGATFVVLEGTKSDLEYMKTMR